MSRVFGNKLLRNRKDLASGHPLTSADDCTHLSDGLNEQVIILGKGDFCPEDAATPLLDWSTFEKGEIAVQLKDTEGLADGRVTIKASTLQRIHPALLPLRLESEYLLRISLETVVLQVEAHLQQSSEELPWPVNPSFDTSIAQVAREDEGFFKLAKVAEPRETLIDEIAPPKRKIPDPVLTPADRPVFPIVRDQSPSEDRNSRSSSSPRVVTFVYPKSTQPATELAEAERDRQTAGGIEPGSRSRIGLERLREIFMTEDQVDARQVANLLAAFPKVNSAMVMLGDGTVLGGTLPDGYDLETTLRAPAVMRSVREFRPRQQSNDTLAFSLLGDRLVTLFAEGNIYILVSHEGRGLLPGMRQRIVEVARALDALCG
jgi:hypothetical protein